MQKGDVIEGYTCIGIKHSVGTYQDKTKHEVNLLDLTGVPFKVEELNLKKESDFVINKKVPFVIMSVGSGGKPPWVKVDDKWLDAQSSQKIGLPEKDLIYVAKEGMNIALQRGIAIGETGMDDIVERGYKFAQAIVDNAKKLKGE